VIGEENERNGRTMEMRRKFHNRNLMDLSVTPRTMTTTTTTTTTTKVISAMFCTTFFGGMTKRLEPLSLGFCSTVEQ
jgi:preprotein translocase subunit SecF